MSTTTLPPKVFLGATSEKLPELKIIADALEGIATVILWTDKSLFQASHFILDSLLDKSAAFDFAVFIFGQDDVTISRGDVRASPRDNVIFEAGVFMSRLGRERTLVVAPRGGDLPLKVLTDFGGLVLSNYDLPQDRAELWQAMRPACEEIVRRINDLGARPPYTSLAQLGPRDVLDAGQVLKELIREALNSQGAAVVHNIALDMEITWPILKERIVRDDPEAVENVTWQSLMIEPDTEAMSEFASSTVSPEAARRNRAEIQEFCEAEKGQLRRRRIKFECRAYETVPLMHGFLVEERELLLTLCDLSSDGRLIGKPNPYLRFSRDGRSEATDHVVKIFRSWFNYHWRKATKVWPK